MMSGPVVICTGMGLGPSLPLALLNLFATPTGLVAAAIDATHIGVMWTPADAATTSYVLESSPDGVSWSTLASPTVQFYNHTVSSGATVHYRVSGSNGVQTSLPSAPVSATAAAQTRTLLQWTDFTYLGAFDLPTAPIVGTANDYTSGGLALRYNGAQVQLLSKVSLVQGSQVYEFTPPVINAVAPYNDANVITAWGDVYHGQSWLYQDGSPWVNTPNSGNNIEGVYWDSYDNRLYWNYTNAYTAITTNPTMGFSSLLSSTGPVSAGFGPWRFTNGTGKTRSGVLAIPPWWAATYLSGKRLAAGFGDVYSGDVSTMSPGPALQAFYPPAPAVYTPNPISPGTATDTFSPYLANTQLLGYSINNPGPRSADYENLFPCLISTGTVQSFTANTIGIVGDAGATSGYFWRYLAGARIELSTGESFWVVDHASPSGVVTLSANLSINPVVGTTTYKIYRGGWRGTVGSASGTTVTATMDGISNTLNNAAASMAGIFTGLSLYAISSTGVIQGPNPITAYTYNAGTDVGTFTVQNAWTTLPDTTYTLTVTGLCYKGALAAVGAGTVTLDANAGNQNAFSDGTGQLGNLYIKMLDGAAAGQQLKITGYVGSTKVATYSGSWSPAPAPGDHYELRGVGISQYPVFPNGTTGRGYHQNKDDYGSSAVWIDTGTKHGVLFGGTWATGQYWYESSDIHFESYRHLFRMFDPAALATVAQGSALPDSLDSAWEQNYQFDGVTYPVKGQFNETATGYPVNITGTPSQQIQGMAFDPTTGHLYVLVTFVSHPSGSTPTAPRVYVFHVG